MTLVAMTLSRTNFALLLEVSRRLRMHPSAAARMLFEHALHSIPELFSGDPQ